nr:hypothetical protein [Nakamurella antarctica]
MGAIAAEERRDPHDAVAAALLGLIHRGIGKAQRRPQRRRVHDGIGCDIDNADAYGEPWVQPLTDESMYCLGDRLCGTVHHHDEFFATDSCGQAS